MRINTTFQHGVVAVQSQTELHLLIELTAPTAPVNTERHNLDLALALDRSGSMAGAPLAAAKTAASMLVDQLHDDDKLALITYDAEVQLLAPLGKLDRSMLQQQIAGIRPGGATNFSGGWLKANEELGRSGADDEATPTGATPAGAMPTGATPSRIRRAIILSDGHANHGITDREQLTSIATTFAAQGITTSTIGFGDGFDEELMTALADAGRGGSHFAASTEDLPGIFADEFDDLVSLAAQNVSVELRPSNEVHVIEVLNTHTTVAVPGGVQIQCGDAYGGQAIRLVVKLRIPALPGLGLANVGDLVLRWVSVGEQVQTHTITSPLVVNAVSAEDAADATPDQDVVEEVIVLLAGRRAAEARRLADEGHTDQASKLARESADELRKLRPDHPAAQQLLETADRLEHSAHLMETNAYSAASAKQMHYEARKMSKRKRDDR